MWCSNCLSFIKKPSAWSGLLHLKCWRVLVTIIRLQYLVGNRPTSTILGFTLGPSRQILNRHHCLHTYSILMKSIN